MRSLVTFLIALMLVLPFSAARADEAGDARTFVDNIGKEVIAIVNGGGADKQAKLRQMFEQNVDIDWMAQFVLGRAWATATQEQKDQYLKAYREYLLTRYTTKFADYTGSKYDITGVKPEQGDYTVSMQIKGPKQQQDTSAGYRVRANNGQFKIVDIIVEGVSLITTQRSEFASVVQQKGIDGLVSAIQAKTQNEAQGSK